MKFKGLTNIGKRHLAKIHANKDTLEFTKIKFGDGTLRTNEDPLNLLEIKNFKMEEEILEVEVTDNITAIETVIDNLNLTYGFHVREFGIFVKDGNTEILYYYMNDDTEASWMPPASDGPHKMEIKINLVMANAASVVVNTEDHDLYLTKSYFLKKLAEKMNNIIRKSGFNLDKTDEYTLDDTSKLATGRALKRLFDEIVRRIEAIKLTWEAITGKPNFSSSVNSIAEDEIATPKGVKTAYDKGVEALNLGKNLDNSKFDKTGGTMSGDLSIKNGGDYSQIQLYNNTNQKLIIESTTNNQENIGNIILRKATSNGSEGNISKLFIPKKDGILAITEDILKKHAEIVGKNYGGILNVSGRKSAGLTYFDNNTKKLFLCKNDNSDISANVNNYIALDNNSLLERLENLSPIGKYIGKITVSKSKQTWKHGTGIFLLIHDHTHGFVTQSVITFIQFSDNNEKNINNNNFSAINILGDINHGLKYHPLNKYIFLDSTSNWEYEFEVYKINTLIN